jgi:sulfite reductase alpha subunit-like flavoprotein
MAPGVHAALASALGEEKLTNLEQTGRYRRDVY